MPEQIIKIGSRGSKLALTQANYIAGLLRQKHNNVEFKINIIKTTGDRDRASSLAQIGGVGLFTKQIENELLRKKIDVAVHSAKDLPSAMTEGLMLGAVPVRESCEDVWISREGYTFENVPEGGVIGTSSPRRMALILNKRRDLRFINLRGNVETRLKKLQDGECDAIVVALAGLKRLGLERHVTEVMDPDEFLPAPGQGALAVQIRQDDSNTLEIVKELNDNDTHRRLNIERLLLYRLNAGCSAAVGALTSIDESQVHLKAVVLDGAGKNRLTARAEISINEPDDLLVNKAVDDLMSRGARDIIEKYN